MAIYRIITLAVLPFVLAGGFWRLLAGRETPAEIGERLALGVPTMPVRHRVWIHGASLGEMTSARALLEKLLAEDPGLHMIVTVNTTSAREMVEGWQLGRTEVRLAPLDYPSVVRRFLRRWRPRAAITLENELWPVRLTTCADTAVPVIAVAARMSARSARRWSRLPGLARRSLGAITYLSPMDSENMERFQSLGIGNSHIGPAANLKATVRLAPPDEGELRDLSRHLPRSATVLAASTHEGEEELVLDAFLAARGRQPELRLILAPRHTGRAAQVAALIEARGLNCWRRSDRAPPPAGWSVLLADSFGEMALWYSLAKVTFVGGGMGARGGHTPVEPAQFASAILHGPDVSNHADAYAALHQREAAIEVRDVQSLAAGMLLPLVETEAMARRATEAVEHLRRQGADLDGLAAAIAGLIGPPDEQAGH